MYPVTNEAIECNRYFPVAVRIELKDFSAVISLT